MLLIRDPPCLVSHRVAFTDAYASTLAIIFTRERILAFNDPIENALYHGLDSVEKSSTDTISGILIFWISYARMLRR